MKTKLFLCFSILTSVLKAEQVIDLPPVKEPTKPITHAEGAPRTLLRKSDVKVGIHFPCDLSQFEHLPPMIFDAQEHETSPYLENDALLAEMAAKGEIYLSLEGGFPEVPTKFNWFHRDWGHWTDGAPGIRGYDDAVPHGVVNSMLEVQDLQDLQGYPLDKQKQKYLSFLLSDNPLTPRVLERVLAAESWQGNGLKMIQALQKAAASGGSEQGREIIASWGAKEPFYTDPKTREAVFRRIVTEFATMALENPTRTNKKTPASVLKMANRFLEGTGDDSLLEPLAIGWRRPLMEQNLATQYCDAAKNGKPLHVITGLAHAGPMSFQFANASGGKIPIQTSDALTELNELNAQLKNKSFDHPSSVKARQAWLTPLAQLVAKQAPEIPKKGKLSLPVTIAPRSEGGLDTRNLELDWPPASRVRGPQ